MWWTLSSYNYQHSVSPCFSNTFTFSFLSTRNWTQGVVHAKHVLLLGCNLTCLHSDRILLLPTLAFFLVPPVFMGQLKISPAWGISMCPDTDWPYCVYPELLLKAFLVSVKGLSFLPVAKARHLEGISGFMKSECIPWGSSVWLQVHRECNHVLGVCPCAFLYILLWTHAGHSPLADNP